MKKTLLLATTTALMGFAFAAPAASAAGKGLTVMSWGGAYGNSQIEAYDKPFTKETGIKVTMVSADNPGTVIKSMVEANNVNVDVFDVETSDVVRLCDEGLLVPIDAATLPPAPDGTPATKDFLPGALRRCGVASILWATVVAYNTKYVNGTPTTIADFFDLKKFPGKRGMRKGAKVNLEMALMATGVKPADVYKVLGTPEGVNRAFKELDKIKGSMVWWSAGAQPPQLLADGEVAMTTAYNGRIFNAQIVDKQPFKVIWDGEYLDFDLFVIPKGAPHEKEALQYIKFATDTKQLAAQASWISYGPARRSSAALVGFYHDSKLKMAPYMPTSPKNMKNSLTSNFGFWADNGTTLNERFNAWLAK